MKQTKTKKEFNLKFMSNLFQRVKDIEYHIDSINYDLESLKADSFLTEMANKEASKAKKQLDKLKDIISEIESGLK